MLTLKKQSNGSCTAYTTLLPWFAKKFHVQQNPETHSNSLDLYIESEFL